MIHRLLCLVQAGRFSALKSPLKLPIKLHRIQLRLGPLFSKEVLVTLLIGTFLLLPYFSSKAGRCCMLSRGAHLNHKFSLKVDASLALAASHLDTALLMFYAHLQNHEADLRMLMPQVRFTY